MGRFQINGAGFSCVYGEEPCTCTDTPRISCLETGEVELRRRRNEVVASIPGKVKKVLGEHTANGVRAMIVVVSVATAISVPSRQRFL